MTEENKNLNDKVEECISEIENGITLLGVSALEDKLQDEVTSCLNSFIEAGIEVLMLIAPSPLLDDHIGIVNGAKHIADEEFPFALLARREQCGQDRFQSSDEIGP